MNEYQFENPFKCSKEQNEILSTLSMEQCKAVDAMMKENIYASMRYLLADIDKGYSYPTLWNDVNTEISKTLKDVLYSRRNRI